ncbi:uncharacterized protein LOC121994737 [Zingiber officinale]|uniref:uncharacterized protein LOC121994737 n=1 Tax=Zingiber officinale TaxID=94328 RepID=UPI001C4A9DB6|nr:uncharacterized protein LOC121994737 [Zingiber officinale]
MPSEVPNIVWQSWRVIWVARHWQDNSAIAHSNRNSELVGSSTESIKYTARSYSMVEHASDLAAELQKPTTCWEIFNKTHKKKDGSFVDLRSSRAITTRVAEASQPSAKGGESQPLSTDAVNDIYYDIISGNKKTSLYGLGS